MAAFGLSFYLFGESMNKRNREKQRGDYHFVGKYQDNRLFPWSCAPDAHEALREANAYEQNNNSTNVPK